MPKILVVDDEPDVEQLIRQRFRRRIRNGDFECVFAANGVEALAAIQREPDIDMVLTDINMPQMDGLTLLDQLGQADPMIKAVVVSAYGDMKNIRTAMNRGAFDFVTKPIDFTDLEVTLEKTLDHLQMIREALAARDGLVAIHRELEVAASLQQSLLPTRFPSDIGHQMFATMIPAKDVAGDFYDFFRLDSNHLGFAVADVSGKGMSAALFMAVSRTLLRASAANGLPPGACLNRVNHLLCVDNDTCMFVTMFYGVLDTRSGEIIYANGGHCLPYVIDAAGSVRALAMTGGLALGVMDDLEYVEKRVTLGAGESLFLYSDGVTEAFDSDGNEFGDRRLIEVLAAGGGLDPSSLLAKVTDAVGRFAASEAQSDDITCMAIRRDPVGGGKPAAVDSGAGGQSTPSVQGGGPHLELTLVNRIGEVGRLAEVLEEFGAANGLTQKVVLEVNLVLEELLTNTISYGYDDDHEHEIAIRLSLRDGTLAVEFEDDGKAFDPLTAPAPELDAALEDRAVGGLGVHLARSLMDNIEYTREGGRNRIRMAKSI